ncbi:SDR family oxidoreductase [Polymorphobacter fuscus]|uniref:SDR family oxidoreductase n=1 Tax=Sandarakinorhabdus fusca TaxID=1439888 RepID=A0A7C9KXY9_9SPHN|nr:SDR family oxidoreductase [Polymorphobacter fuscus]KAB7644423.1 SDR family oxidoreductase [Polymorphobacter fuscus]MQT18345.1 SDR family oxidoreductase [Polymorphobacter fuscus]NJC08245.1 NAD(P)-dependent dehydrogenase (short-subunit alcohol dehydrogenase family) [Polymorphobacter fuscus]
MGRIDGRVAFVTGAGAGIGRAAALALAREGARVMLTDIDAEGGRATAAMIAAAGGEGQFRGQDVTEEDRWAELMTRTLTLFGRLDILVNNAGIAIGLPITEMSLDQWNRQLAINLTGVFLGMKHAIPAMRTQKPEGSYRGGSIINISSVAGLVGSAGLAGYCATKGGVRLFSKAVAMECAAAGDGIRVNSVHPGIIDTAIWQKMDAGGIVTAIVGEGSNAPPADAIAAIGTPLGFAGLPQDIADGIVFLASDESRYMTGSELVIDGGWTAH